MMGLGELLEKSKTVSNRFTLGGKRAVVVGGNKGLGQAMTLALASAGADVCVVGRGPEGLADTAQAAETLGVKGRYFAADVTVESKVEELVEFLLKECGGIDILVNSQGTVHLQESTSFDMEAWRRVMDVNLTSLVYTCRHVGRVMLAQGKGKIINISSVRAYQGRAGDLAYAPSKGAVNQLTRSLAIEWGPLGINVNGIAPAFTITALNEAMMQDPKKREWALSRIPMKRLGELDDFFGPVVFLASDASSFVNGHILAVDGGWLIA